MRHAWLLALALAACSGSEEGTDWKLHENNGTANNGTSNNGANNGTANVNNGTANNGANNGTANNGTANNGTTQTTESCLPSVPERHRPNAVACETDRAPGVKPPDEELSFAECQSDADCTEGDEGRCTGNSHDGYYCTYNACSEDGDCGRSVCACNGGWRSDHNVCLPGNCQTDADCGEAGFCSPSFGSCGNYFGDEAYYCRTCEDECVNDSDCGNDGDTYDSYCAFDPGVGHWRCADTHCAG